MKSFKLKYKNQKSSLLLYKLLISDLAKYTYHRYTYKNIKCLTLKYKNFCIQFFFKIRLCFYKKIVFSQYHLNLPKYTFHRFTYDNKIFEIILFYNIHFFVGHLLYIFSSAPMDDSSLFFLLF